MSNHANSRFPSLAGLCLLVLLAPGCATNPGVAPDVSLREILDADNAFGPRPDLPTPDAIHRLTPAQEADFLAFMGDPDNAVYKPNERLYEYLSRKTRHFAYDGTTFSAARTLAQNSGNCMSLAVLTTALADLAGVETAWQLMDDVPVYEFNDTAIIKGLHIRSLLYDPQVIEVDGALMMSRSGIKIDYFPTNRQRFISNLDRGDYLAMYYQNKAAEALQAGDPDRAYWLAREALVQAPDYAAAINTLAVLNRRAGRLETAEAIYRFGIAHADNKLSLLKNYRVLLQASGRVEEADAISRRLERLDDPSPFHWYQLARSSFEEGDFKTAIRYYNKALDLAPYLHEAYLGIALSNYELGRLDRTRRALVSATEEAEKVSTRQLYQAKLAALSRQTGGSPGTAFPPTVGDKHRGLSPLSIQ